MNAQDQDLDLFAWATTPRRTEEAKPKPFPQIDPAIDYQYEPAPPPAPPLDRRMEAPGIVTQPSVERDPTGLWVLKRDLRPYQGGMRRAVHEAKAAGKTRGLLVAATGAGKTVVFSALCADVQPKRALVLTDQQDLVDQAIRNIKATTGLFADAEQGERSASPNAQIVVATVQTLIKKLTKYPPDHFDLVVCDECDRAVSPQWKKVLARFDEHAFVLGVTATPKRSDKKKLTYFGDKLFEIGMLELIDQGYLSPVNVQTLPISIDLTEAEETKDGEETEADYDKDKVAAAVKAVFSEVCKAIKVYAPTRKILVFLPNVITSMEFADVANEHGIKAQHIDGESRDRRAIQQGFRDRRFQLLCNPCLLGRGYDDPSIDCIINLRATKSLGFYQQLVGRGTRLYCPHDCPGPCTHPERKMDMLILDFLYQFKGMGPIRPVQLIADTPNKQKFMQGVTERTQGKLDIREIAIQADRDIKFSLLKALSEAQRAKGAKGSKEYFNAFQWAALLNLDGLIGYEPDTAQDGAPAKPGLVTKLVQAGFVRESITCQGHAEKLMMVVRARIDAGLCSFKQMFYLQKFGVENAETFTRVEAQERLDYEFGRRPRPGFHGHGPRKSGTFQKRKWVKPPTDFGQHDFTS